MTDKKNFTYRVILQPVDRYFFGSERTFVPADGSRTNYLVRSMKMPQQTTILGMLRFSIVKNLMNCKSIEGKEDYARIGPESFNGDNATQYGIIDSISPLFLIKEVNGSHININLLGRDNQLYKSEKTKVKELVRLNLERMKNGKSNIAANNDFIPQIVGYDPKQENGLTWQNPQTHEYMTEDDIFKNHEQPGNQKSYTGAALDDAFYKQTYCHLSKGYRFAFYFDSMVQLETPVSYIVFMGGDKSEFKVTIDEGVNHFSDDLKLPEPESDSTYIVTFVSDAFIDQETIKLADFSINEMVDFRYVGTKVKMSNFADLDQSNTGKELKDRPSKSSKKQLVRKGGVFYLQSNNLSAFLRKINEQTAFQKIGYNYFKTEKIEK